MMAMTICMFFSLNLHSVAFRVSDSGPEISTIQDAIIMSLDNWIPWHILGVGMGVFSPPRSVIFNRFLYSISDLSQRLLAHYLVQKIGTLCQKIKKNN